MKDKTFKSVAYNILVGKPEQNNQQTKVEMWMLK